MRNEAANRPTPGEGRPDTATGVEPVVLRQLMDVAGVEFAREVAALYVVTAAEKVAAVVQGTAADAPARVLAAAHSLASCAGAVGARAVEAHARVIEGEAVAARLPDATALAALEQDFAASRPALDAVLAALAAEGDGSDAGVTEDDCADENVMAALGGTAARVLAAP